MSNPMNPSSPHDWPPASLAPSPEQIAEMGRAAVHLIADYFGSLPDLPIFPSPSNSAVREKLPTQAPVEGVPFDRLLDFVQRAILHASRHNGHPRFFDYVASPGTAATALADLLASALNPNVTSWRSAPGPTDLERQTIQWIRQIVGCALEADGLFVSGGSMANLSGLAAGGGQALGCAMRVYISEEGPHSVSKAAGLLGIGRDNVRAVPTDDQFRMDARRLAKAIKADRAAGHLPFCVVASAGTVNTGSSDDLAQVADVAERYGLWLHVDASYGGFAAIAPSKRVLFCSIERADSVALDPHKWLYAPIKCGCILYRDPSRAGGLRP